MNLKPRCVICRKELSQFRNVLMIGPQGYRRYALCNTCAEKVEKKQSRGDALRKLETKKAGV